MTDTEKVALIGQIITDFWGYNTDEQITAGAPVIMAAISSVVEFEGGSDNE